MKQPIAPVSSAIQAADEEIARMLRDDLEFRNIKCFLARDDMLAGDKIMERVEREIGELKHVLLLISQDSLRSDWVEYEVKTAFHEESLRRRNVLIPVRLDEAVLSTTETWARRLLIDRQIDDISRWEDKTCYRQSLDRLVAALTTPREW